MIVNAKIISSLEKVFANKEVSDYARLDRMSALLGERIAVQLIYKNERFADGNGGEGICRTLLTPTLSGDLAKYATVRRVVGVPVTMPSRDYDGNYLDDKPGVYPDLLLPLNYGGRVRTDIHVLGNIWIDIELPEDKSVLPAISKLTVSITDDYSKSCVFEDSVEVEIINKRLPKQEIYYTRWFHTDCLASYYDVPVWSKRHWEIIENFAKLAVMTGVNTLLTPLLTPSLDGPRMITQLVKISKNGDKYSFNFSRLDKWIDMCDRIGIEYFEISHLFTQGGAVHTPRIVATVDGEEKMIFSYENDSRDPEYKVLLRALLKAFIRHMKKRGDDKRCIFHISDEPSIDNIEYYRYAKSVVADILEGYKMIDALSHMEYYTEGLVECPVPMTRDAAPFIEANIPGLWTYYCCGPTNENYSNSFIAMPSWRTRSMGMQMYKYNIEGFLHWGYNFYNNCNSDSQINPYVDLSGENWVPAGDAFIVYPDKNGKPLESLRAEVFYHALCDLRAMKLCEKYYSHEEVVEAIEAELGDELTFKRCAYSADEVIRVREKINGMIKKAISK